MAGSDLSGMVRIPGPAWASPSTALEFFDPTLGGLPQAADLVRLLLNGTHASTLVLDESYDDFVFSRLNYHRLLPQLNVAIRSGNLVVSGEFRQRLDRALQRFAVHSLGLQRLLVDVGRILDTAGVEFLVLKGMSTAHLDHADPALRQAGDLDLLVRRAQREPAAKALASAGFTPPDAAGLLMDKGGSWTEPLGKKVDIHSRLHAAGGSLSERWWLESDGIAVAGHEFRALNRTGRMAHAASHLALTYPNHRILSSLLDLVVINRSSTSAERAAVRFFLDDMGVEDIVYRITTRAASLMDDTTIVLGSPGHRPLDWVLRQAYDRPDLDLVVLKLAKTLGMPPGDRLQVIRNWVAPSEEFLAAGGYSSAADRISKVWGRIRAR